jgi:DNA-binding NarL/FixJ family response regulator
LIDVTERKQLQDTLLLYTSAEYRLSEREQEIIRLVKEGCSNKEISAKLFIEAATVKNHLYRIFRKTKARSRTELLKILGS